MVILTGAAACLALASCSTTSAPAPKGRELRVSVADQKMALYENGAPLRVYKVSTSKFGVGDSPASNCTPLGKMRVAKKIGNGLPPGMVFKSRRPTGEILRPNAAGRDPVVTRILWLDGTEPKTRNAYRRFIYIHGTPEERNIGQPASYGCIRMRSMDVIDLYNQVAEGIPVVVDKGKLPAEARRKPEYVYVAPPAPVSPLKHAPASASPAAKTSGETQLASAKTVPAATKPRRG
ncbi:MAG: L,D-transpeptidase [Verrucomicrobiaceae bacterium]|nr:MAG: L,D-transpeptidase [Verrucomicrobiaceae bacterium]